MIVLPDFQYLHQMKPWPERLHFYTAGILRVCHGLGQMAIATPLTDHMQVIAYCSIITDEQMTLSI